MTDPVFLASVNATIAFYEDALGRPATRTRQMIERRGAVDALALLVISGELQQGFRVLRDGNQLAQTFEALVVRFGTLFDAATVQAAQFRLDHADELDRPSRQ